MSIDADAHAVLKVKPWKSQKYEFDEDSMGFAKEQQPAGHGGNGDAGTAAVAAV